MGRFANTFTDRQEFDKLFGVTGVRILTDEGGNPLINPSNEEMKLIFPDYKPGEEEKKYTGTQKLTWGWTDLQADGGKKRVSQKEYDELPPMEREDVVLEEEVGYARVSFAVETAEKVRKLITFKFFNAPSVTKKGDKKEVFNRYGKTTYVTADGAFGSESFEHGEDDLVREVPFSTGHLDFKDMINFLYAYSSLSRKIALLDNIDVEGLLEGDVSSIKDLVSEIHEDIVSEDGKPLYGATVLFTVDNNNSTGNEFRQSYYHVFERWIMNSKGETNKSFSRIMRELGNERKPTSNGIVYSPESRGSFVGHNGIPKLGLHKFKNSYGEKLLAGMVQRASMATTTAGKTGSEDNPFGGESFDDVEF